VQPARKDDPNLHDTLPDPRLNPMINPRLGKNLGRWAKVYYTTPPERRDQAVLALVRELEGGEASPAEAAASASTENEIQQAVAPALNDNPVGPISGVPERRFCGHCGSRLKKNAPLLPNPTGSLPGSEPRVLSLEQTLLKNALPIEDDSADTASPRQRSRAQILVVLLVSMAIAAWGLWHIRFASAPQSTAHVIPIVKQTAPPAASIVQPRIRQTAPPLSQPAHDTSSNLSKPAAGTPVGCTSDHLSNCRADELYSKSVSLADGIDARFIAYDKRMNQLLRDATAHTQKGASPRPDRLRQANYSAQLWEHLQLRAYTIHERREALRFRAELMRRIASAKSERNLLRTYENPHSCLDLHYIADNLRRLAARVPRSSSNTFRASLTPRPSRTSP
jgi:hypothetical protein